MIGFVDDEACSHKFSEAHRAWGLSTVWGLCLWGDRECAGIL